MKMKLLLLIALLGLSCQVFAGDPNVPGMIQHYTFDGDLNDSEGTNHGTAMNEGPEFVEGVIGQAAKFYGNRYIDLGSNAFPNSTVGLNTGSVCFWFNSVATTTDTIIGSASQSSSLMLNVLFVSQRLRCAIRDDNGAMRQVDVDDTSLRDGQWHHVALVYATGPETVVTVYVDGEPQDLIVRASGNPEVFSAWEFPLYVGMLNNRGVEANAYTGILDDLRVYNYTLDPIEVATIYTEVRTDETLCVIPPEYDYDGDCRVTLADMAYIMEEWLDCGLVPTCLP